jgi:succinate dehydrogenase / fumarate reductase iron-sulfur subunit
MQDFEFDAFGKDLMVLDVLEKLKVEDPSLVFRRSCREGVCGSDGMNISGKNGLACITPLSEAIRNNKITIRPLPGLPVIRDLVIDMKQFYVQYEKIEPYMVNDSPAPQIERLQSQEERAVNSPLPPSCPMSITSYPNEPSSIGSSITAFPSTESFADRFVIHLISIYS